MNFLDKISEYFSSHNNLINASTGKFNKINKSKIAQILDIENRSLEKANRNIPQPNNRMKDDIAADIDECMTFILTEGKEYIKTKIEAISLTTQAQIEDLKDTDKSRAKIKEIGEGILSKLYSNVKTQFNVIYDLKEQLIISKQSLNDFKINNGIDRNARIPDSKFLSLGIIGILFILELFINAFTLRDVHPDGLAGALIEIFMFSSINIIVGFSVGYLFIRKIYRIEIGQKIIGFLMTSVVFFLGLIFNLGIGHYRDNLLKLVSLGYEDRLVQVNNIGTPVLNDLMTNTMIYGDMKCYLITFAGILFFLYSAKKGVDWDDPYPEYGLFAKEVKEINLLYTDQVNESQNELTKISTDGISEVNGWLTNNRSSIQAIRQKTRDKINLNDQYKTLVERVKTIGEALYSQYRTVNIDNREDNKTPKSFEVNEFKISDTLLKLPETDTLINQELTETDNLFEEAENLYNEAQSYQNKISESLNEYLRVFQLIETVERLDRNSKYADKIDSIHREFSSGS